MSETEPVVKDPLDRLRDNIAHRSDRDLIMNIVPMFLIMAAPLLFMLILLILTEVHVPATANYLSLMEYAPAPLMVPVLLEALIISTVLYRMYSRLRDHALRDEEWRQCLIDYAQSKGADTSKLERIHEKGKRMSRFPARFPATVILIAMYVWVLGYFFYVLPTGMDWEAVILYILPIGMAFVVLQLATVAIKVLRYPHIHEQNQIGFVKEFGKAMGMDGLGMTPRVKHHGPLFHLVLTMCTFGVYLVFLAKSLLRASNDHIKGQWDFEDRLMRFLENGSDPEKAPMPRSRAMHARRMKDTKLPLTLVAAEVFMIAVVMVYAAKLTGTAVDIAADPAQYNIMNLAELMAPLDLQGKLGLLMKYVMIVWNVVFMALTVDAMMSIASRRTTAWRKVVQTCITFAVPTWISSWLYSVESYTHLFDLGPWMTTSVLYVILLFMLVSMPVKRFYTPSTMETPGMKSWIRFAVHGDLEPDS